MGTLFCCRLSTLRGEVRIPTSKSHTIRAVAIASLAAGESRVRHPLESADTAAAVRVYRALGAEIEQKRDVWLVRGTGGELIPPDDVLDVGNSGTTMRIVLGSCALLRSGAAVITGDEQSRRRPCGPLLNSLNDLGARAFSTRENGLAPFVVQGRLAGGKTAIEAHTSQYLTSLLLCAPLADGESVIDVPVLNEQPYVEMTLDWIRRQGIELEQEDLRRFRIAGGQEYQPFDRAVPADFSSATFFLAAGALGANDITACGLDMDDPQGDKAVVDYLRQMGAQVEIEGKKIRVRPGDLRGTELDLNNTPDALPMMAVLGCFARGTTRLVNVPQARIKESDRIAVMCSELSKMGARVEELEDGLVVHESKLKGTRVSGHGDHRVVMALAVAGLASPGETVIDTAEAVSVTFPTFAQSMIALGANMDVRQEI